MKTTRLIVGGLLILAVFFLSGIVLWDRQRVVATPQDPAVGESAVLAVVSPALSMSPPGQATGTLPSTPTAQATERPLPTPVVQGTLTPYPTRDLPPGSGTGQIGSLAIEPRTQSPAPGQAAITEEDVRQHLASYGLNFIRLRSVGPYAIETVTFLPYAEARVTRGISAGVPEDRLLCLVDIRGTFTLTGVWMPNSEPRVSTYQRITLVFDAVSGNQLGERAFPQDLVR